MGGRRGGVIEERDKGSELKEGEGWVCVSHLMASSFAGVNRAKGCSREE